MTISECVRSSPWWGVVKSLGYYRRGPVGLVHTQKIEAQSEKPTCLLPLKPGDRPQSCSSRSRTSSPRRDRTRSAGKMASGASLLPQTYVGEILPRWWPRLRARLRVEFSYPRVTGMGWTIRKSRGGASAADRGGAGLLLPDFPASLQRAWLGARCCSGVQRRGARTSDPLH